MSEVYVDESYIKLMEKLTRIQSELFVPKGKKNDFGNYNYRTCEDILLAVKPLVEKEGCTLKLDTLLKDCGGRTYVEAIAFLFDRETGKGMAAHAYAREPETKKGMDEAQITGASTSYARKYALAGLFCIDNEKDSDVTNKQRKDDDPTTITDQQISALHAELERTGISESVILDSVKKKTVQEMTHQDYTTVMKRLNATKG